jgi:non-ribosomal peptide synthetase component F
VEDWRGAADLDRRVANYLQEDRQHGFRPADLPPVRATLVRTGEEAHRLLLSFHHVLLDGWSTALLLKELFERYAALTNGTTLQLAPGRPYADYVAWLQNLDQTAAHFYWRQQLAGYQPPLPLGAGPARGALMTGAHRDATLSQEVTAGLTAAARRYGVTPGTLVQGAWALLLAGLTGQNDLVFGSVFAGRPAELEGAEAMIGLLMNTLPIRTRLTPSIALGTWLSALQQQVTDAAEHGYVSAAQAARLAALHPTQPLFESAVFFENYPVDESLKAGAAGVRLSGLRFHEQHHYPLSLIAMPGERLGLRVLTHQDRFSPSAAAGLTQRLTDLLEAMATESEPTLQDLLRLARPAAQLAMSAGE